MHRIIEHMGAPLRRSLVVAVFLALLCGLFPHTIFAAPTSFSVMPAVIDGEAKPREILRYKVTIVNNLDRMVSVYAWGKDLDANGEIPERDGVDPAESLLAWMQYSRGVIDIPAKETVELPLQVQVHLRAKPGIYHAMLRVSEGPNRAEAELNTAGTHSVYLNINVPDDANERLNLGTFTAEKSVFMGDEATFDYRLENTGNRGIAPSGEIRIFDRRGEEVDVVPINSENLKIEPEASALLGAVWASGERFGKYKAMLDVSYGKSGTIQDTVFFWVLPWKRIMSLFLTLALISVVISLLLHSYLTSGGKSLAPARVTSGGATSRVDYIDDLVRVVRRKFFRPTEVDTTAPPPTARMEPLIEVTPPEPIRTRYRALETPHAPIRLEKKGSHVPHPDHIVRLKK